MTSNVDDRFYERADAHIHLANAQMEEAKRGKVSASMLYAVARFNAWTSATGFDDGADMASRKEETMKYFIEQYTQMLSENLDDYIENFERYMKPPH